MQPVVMIKITERNNIKRLRRAWTI